MKYMKLISSIVVLLTVPPFSVSLALNLLYLGTWGDGTFSISTVLGMMMFAYISFVLWILYLPAIPFILILVPNIINSEKYRKIKALGVFARMAMVGAIGGIAVLAPAWVTALFDTAKDAEMWIVSGAIAGVITSTIIVLIYRDRNSHERDKLNQADAPGQTTAR